MSRPNHPLSSSADKIIVRGLKLSATVGMDRWEKTRPQPILLSIYLETKLTHAGESDDVEHTIDYGALSKKVLQLCDGKEFHGLAILADTVADHALTYNGAERVCIEAEALNQFRLARSLCVRITRMRRSSEGPPVEIKTSIMELCVPVIIGVNDIERKLKQNVITTVTFNDWNWIANGVDWMALNNQFECRIEETKYLTLEAFAREMARKALSINRIESVTIYAQKPSALVYAESSGVEITRHRSQFKLSELEPLLRSGED